MDLAYHNQTLSGTIANKGIAFGRICFLKREKAEQIKKTVDNTNDEIDRFEKARLHAISQLGALYEASWKSLVNRMQ